MTLLSGTVAAMRAVTLATCVRYLGNPCVFPWQPMCVTLTTHVRYLGNLCALPWQPCRRPPWLAPTCRVPRRRTTRSGCCWGQSPGWSRTWGERDTRERFSRAFFFNCGIYVSLWIRHWKITAMARVEERTFGRMSRDSWRHVNSLHNSFESNRVNTSHDYWTFLTFPSWYWKKFTDITNRLLRG